MCLPSDSHYEPVKPVSNGGFIMLRKKDPQWKSEELVVMSAGALLTNYDIVINAHNPYF